MFYYNFILVYNIIHYIYALSLLLSYFAALSSALPPTPYVIYFALIFLCLPFMLLQYHAYKKHIGSCSYNKILITLPANFLNTQGFYWWNGIGFYNNLTQIKCTTCYSLSWTSHFLLNILMGVNLFFIIYY